MQIIYAVIFAGLVGFVCGVLPGLAQRLFDLENDERKELVTSLLPGVNCGGCGCAGCAAFAEALLGNNARIDACCGGLLPENAEKLSDILGMEAAQKEKEVMTVDHSICVGCGLCAKVCPHKAITIKNKIVHIDENLCTGCGLCAKKCPKGCLVKS